MYDRQTAETTGDYNRKVRADSAIAGSGLAGSIAIGGAGCIPPGPPAVRSEIAQELSEQEEALRILGQSIEALEEQLSPVLLGASPEKDLVVGHHPCGSQIASCINQNTTRIRAAFSRVAQLRERLAL